MLLQRWRSSDCLWLTAVAMVTPAESASFPGIHTVAGTSPGGSASPSHPRTIPQLGMIRCDVTAIVGFYLSRQQAFISNLNNTASIPAEKTYFILFD